MFWYHSQNDELTLPPALCIILFLSRNIKTRAYNNEFKAIQFEVSFFFSFFLLLLKILGFSRTQVLVSSAFYC